MTLNSFATRSVAAASPHSPTKRGSNAGTYCASSSGVSRSGSTVTNSTCTRSRVGAEHLHRLGERRERRRADVGALREAEEHDDRLAAEVGERARLAVVVGQREVAAERRAGDVGRS